MMRVMIMIVTMEMIMNKLRNNLYDSHDRNNRHDTGCNNGKCFIVLLLMAMAVMVTSVVILNISM